VYPLPRAKAHADGNEATRPFSKHRPSQATNSPETPQTERKNL
jgi:hypothetical protein